MKQVLRIAVISALALAGGLLFRTLAAEPIYIASDSMAPTLTSGHHLILDKITYRFRPPRRQELICFSSPVGEDHDSVKRVIAVAGDTIEIRNKKVYLNGERQLEIYASHTRPDEILDGDNLGPLTVPEGAVFVLGDNRDNSNDSSTWRDKDTGEKFYFLKLKLLKGRIRGIY